MNIEEYLAKTKPIADAAMEKYLPRAYDAKSLEYTLGKPHYAYDANAATNSISKPVWDLLDRGGKRWRPALMLLAYEAFGGSSQAMHDLLAVPELIHNGTLIVDDIEDSSPLRRGKPAIHAGHGIDIAINAGNALYFIPLLIFKEKEKEFGKEIIETAFKVYTQEMINVSFGQGFDIHWHKNHLLEVTEEQYLQMCAYKTGCLARMAAKLGAIFAKASAKEIDAIGRFAEAIGVAFQIQDDILNLTGEEFAKGKGLGEDIHEGKLTLLVLHSLKTLPKDNAKRLREIIGMHTSDEALIGEAIALIKEGKGIAYANERAKQLVQDAWKEMEPLLKPSDAKETLHAFAEYLIARSV